MSSCACMHVCILLIYTYICVSGNVIMHVSAGTRIISTMKQASTLLCMIDVTSAVLMHLMIIYELFN